MHGHARTVCMYRRIEVRFLRGRATPRPGSHGARARACLYMKSGSRLRVTHRGEQKGMRGIVARGVVAQRYGRVMGISSQIAPSRVWQRTRSSWSYANVIVKAPREDARNANHTFQRRARLDCWPCSMRRAILKPEAKALSGASLRLAGDCWAGDCASRLSLGPSMSTVRVYSLLWRCCRMRLHG